MKKFKNIINTLGLAACMGVSVVSCSLDLLPLNAVVLENFWTDKNDVNSVLFSCYEGMCENGWVEKAIVWGEVRSDNVDNGPRGVPQAIQDINKGNLKQTNTYCDWGAFYTVINRCNTLIYYSKDMHEEERDPNFTTSDYNQVVAEASAIRALNYFYLIRTFKDVPFTFQPSVDDTQNYMRAPSPFENILDSLIDDVEATRGGAVGQFTAQTSIDEYKLNSARFTRAGINTLLADMYLWRASNANVDAGKRASDYRRCIDLCDQVLDFKYRQYEEDADHTLKSKMDKKVTEAYGYPLLSERDASQTAGTSAPPDAYNAIFGKGNSWESLFELTFGEGRNDVKNNSVANMYGGFGNGATSRSSETAYLSANTSLMSMPLTNENSSYKVTGTNQLFQVCSDYRTLTSFRYTDTGNYHILKYVVPEFKGSENDFGKSTNSDWKEASNKAENDIRFPGEKNYAGWIIYRLSDVMLIRAEAEIELGNILAMAPAETTDESTNDGDGTGSVRRRERKSGSSLSTTAELYEDAFNLISAIYLRSNPDSRVTAGSNYCPKKEDYNTYERLVELVEEERHREFLFEGKRYYDLVRRSRKEGNTTHYQAALQLKFGEASRAVLNKMKEDVNFMYMPYAEAQLKVNPQLKQNSAYAENEDKNKITE